MVICKKYPSLVGIGLTTWPFKFTETFTDVPVKAVLQIFSDVLLAGSKWVKLRIHQEHQLFGAIILFSFFEDKLIVVAKC